MTLAPRSCHCSPATIAPNDNSPAHIYSSPANRDFHGSLDQDGCCNGDLGEGAQTVCTLKRTSIHAIEFTFLIFELKWIIEIMCLSCGGLCPPTPAPAAGHGFVCFFLSFSLFFYFFLIYIRLELWKYKILIKIIMQYWISECFITCAIIFIFMSWQQ